MFYSNDLNYYFNMPLNLKSSNDLIKKEAFKMNDYLKSNKAFQLAMETLKSESRYNVGMIEAKEEGIEQKEKEIILNMHKKGISKEDIADMTGINIEKINKTLNM